MLPADLPSAIERLQADAKELRKSLSRMQESLAVHEAARLRAAAASDGGVVVQVIDGWDAAGLKAIASALTTEPG